MRCNEKKRFIEIIVHPWFIIKIIPSSHGNKMCCKKIMFEQILIINLLENFSYLSYSCFRVLHNVNNKLYKTIIPAIINEYEIRILP